jgi:Tol biopolymer transport system component
MLPPAASEPVQITTAGDASKPAWSPDGAQLVFVRPGGLFKVPASGTPVTPVTATPGDTDPAWSPDGGRIAFVRGGDIFVMPADGSTAARRVRGEDAALANPTWSPESCDLAFTWKTWVLKARSSDGTGVTGVGNGMREPSWAPTGRLAVAAADGIRLVNSNGTGEVRLSGTGGGQVPSWRADGSEVAYRAGDGIRTAPSNGSTAPVLVPGTVAGDTDPAW